MYLKYLRVFCFTGSTNRRIKTPDFYITMSKWTARDSSHTGSTLASAAQELVQSSEITAR